MILYEIICNTIIKIKIAVFPPPYCVHLYTAVKGLMNSFLQQFKVMINSPVFALL